jgi:hypothetical protein
MIADPVVSSLAEAVAEVECRFKCINLGTRLRLGDDIGIPLQTSELLVGAGVQSVGPDNVNVPEVFCASEKAVAELWLRLFLEIGHGCSTVYWRIQPELNKNAVTSIGSPTGVDTAFMMYRIYSRQCFT